MNHGRTPPTQLVLDTLTQQGHAPRRSGDGWTSRCPGHDDRTPSLSISQGDDGRALVHCHAGCTVDEVIGAMGLKKHELFEEGSCAHGHRPPIQTHRPPINCHSPQDSELTLYDGVCQAMAVLEARHGSPTHSWEYHDQQGELEGVVVRFDGPGGKSFRPISRRSGQYSSHQDGERWCIAGMESPRPLYALRDIIDSTETVYVCEGEKACEAAIACGLVATTSANGSKSASKTDWSALRDRDVVIVPDHDEPGEFYARAVTGLALQAGASSVRVIRLVEQWELLVKGGDMDDVLNLESGNVAAVKAGVESLTAQTPPEANPEPVIDNHERDCARNTAPGSPVLVSMGDVESQEVSWLWEGRLPLGRLSLLVGRPGEGKSFVTTDWAARVSAGREWPDGSPGVQGSVLLVSAEDDPGDTIRPRLDAHHADVSRVHLLRGVYTTSASGESIEGGFTLSDIDSLRGALAQIGDVKLIVIDPIGSYMGGRVDAHRDNEVRSVLAPLGTLAQEWGVAVVLVAHQRKGGASHADDMVLGSRAFTGIARSVLHLMRDPDDDSRRLLLPGKMNLSMPAAGLGLTIEGTPGCVHWDSDPVTMTASEVLSRSMASTNATSPMNDACEWLRDALSNGPRPASELKAQAKADGLSWRTLERAKKTLGVQSQREGFGTSGSWVWVMPIDRHCPPTQSVRDYGAEWPQTDGNPPISNHMEHESS